MKYVFSFLGFMLVGCVIGQEAQRTSLGMSGGTYTIENGNSSIYVSQSVGQNGVIGSFQGEGYAVRQGFQQPPVRVVSLPQSDQPLDAVVFPNPVVTSVNVQFNESIVDTVEGKLFDVLGKEVLHKEYAPQQSLSIDMSQLPVGTYVLVLGTQGKQFTSRLIKN
ncbi:MAG: T9SS type A sorting domain-containing protein [Flavobacteriaceae bacterium]|nr:T9SS type A sorting domain-containing protein [Flavobacteriaceae bacterium]